MNYLSLYMKFIPKSEETRQRIIEATAVIFNKQGFAGTSLSDLTRATNLTKGGIYGNFKNKEEVALAAFDYNLGMALETISARVSSKKTFTEKLIANIDVYYEQNKEMNESGGCPIQNAIVDSDDTHEELRVRAAQGLMCWNVIVMEIITNGIKAKEFHAGINIEKTALSILAIIEGAILIGRATKEPAKQNMVLDTAKEIVYGLRV
ncbi:TetR/AcrR family transcriptional regulator [Pedobacter antarcticus]|uniref:TetR/AcrR family transcriptional regulator n=1 Tax=Pedobacter antarcticus TaxID=34086 RepID=UPI0029310FB9|nr:TetR/AcrR family transcriptional regulator [Pedobacter antarcticus]